MRRPLPLPTNLGPAFTFSEARSAGVSPKQLRRPDLASPFRGIRTRPAPAPAPEDDQDTYGAPDPFEDPVVDVVRKLASAYALALPPGAHLSHSTAAVMHGIPLPYRAFPRRTDRSRPLVESVLVEAAIPHPGRAPRGVRVQGHQCLAALDPVMELGGIPVSTPAATWATLAARLTVDELVAVGDAIVRVPRIPGSHGGTDAPPMATFEDLDEVVTAGRRIGIRKLREARALVRDGASSPKETELRLALTFGTGLPSPVLDYDVYDRRGRFLGCSELAYPRFRTAVEYEGDYHRTDRDRWQRDIEKYQSYAAAGWRVVQVTAAHLRDTKTTVRRVREVLKQAGWRPAAR